VVAEAEVQAQALVQEVVVQVIHLQSVLPKVQKVVQVVDILDTQDLLIMLVAVAVVSQKEVDLLLVVMLVAVKVVMVQLQK
jgi:hypothetical protein